jgi:hypothetical protein
MLRRKLPKGAAEAVLARGDARVCELLQRVSAAQIVWRTRMLAEHLAVASANRS